ncbi:MFS transporter [Streptomyces sp. DSM 41527]|uniref:MFS transporter n=1 Tax=Streptomyces mooreae TaxID=3075523 RepID=A0ABU2T599_9ACTN|nr:MFS transporter [Streptomyces sp. DSM 41527]MDT0456396.1 MFS transporter [Streptomyces sp. DSM 41527]
MSSPAHPRPAPTPVTGSPPAVSSHSRCARLGIPPALAWGFLGVLLFMTGDGVETGFFSKYLADQGLAKADAAAVIAVYGITVALGAWLSGALSDLWGPRRVMTAGFAIWLVFQLLMLTVALPAMNYPLLMLIYGLRGFGYPLFAYGFLVWVTAATPPQRLGTAVGWYWFAFTGGLPTLGSLVASATIPMVGSYRTLWLALGLVVLGGLLTLLLVREPTGRSGLAPGRGRPLTALAGSVSIMRRRPRVAIGAAVRVFSTGSQFGFLVCLPFFFTETVGFSTSAWLRLLSVMFAANIFANLFFGAVGDRLGWQRTMTWFGAVACALTCLVLYYVPVVAGPHFAAAAVAAALYGIALAGYVPISALVPALAPRHKGQAMSALNLGAGASTFAGPAVVALALGPVGVEGIVWIFAALHLATAVAIRFLEPDPEFLTPDAPSAVADAGLPAGAH